MKRTITITAAAVTLIVAVPLAASADSGSAPTRRASTITLRMGAQLEHVQSVDNQPSGRSAGDMLVFTERLVNSHRRQLGSDAASCVALFDQRWLCSGTYVLAGGQVMVQLVQPRLTGTLTYSQAITGGTGRYAGASGTVTDHQRAGGDQFVFHIRLP
jgi:hypothetical protein